MTRRDIITRVQRLLALGDKAKNNSRAEAELAASMAAKLMAEHRLEQLELEAGAEASEPLVDLDLYANENVRRGASWKSVLADSLARVNGCQTVNSWSWSLEAGRIRRLVVLGRRSSAEAVQYLYRYLVREVEQIARRETRGKGRGYANAFRLGMAERISDRLNTEQRAREQAMSAHATALVRRDDQAVDAFVTHKFPRLKEAPPIHYSSALGLHAGICAGDRVNLGGGKGLEAPARPLKG